MVRNMTINRAKVKQGRRFEIRPLLLRRCSRVALGLLRLSFGNISVMSRFSPGDASVQNHTSEHYVSMILRKQYPAKVAEYAGELLLVGINYDKKEKKHQCRIVKTNVLLRTGGCPHCDTVIKKEQLHNI